ncbi:MAG TPA: DinB family protein [Vicinamibacterales bacterium]|nr:DinB family protein [Vicinamibacterales bacterium]
MTERWLGGPVDGVPALLQPVAHALLQAKDDAAGAVAGLDASQLWLTPGGAASVGYHLRHMSGSLDRLFTYGRGEALSPEQLAALKGEREPGNPSLDAAAIMAIVDAAIERALAQLRATNPDTLLDDRRVGRQGLPSTVIGLLFHAAEHTTRHTGQAITTAKIVRAS